MHPIFSVLISRPELVVEHVASYAALVRQEATTAGTHVVSRLLAWVAAALALLVFFIFAGIAVMLGAMNDEFHWLLVAVPLVPLLLCALAWAMARRHNPASLFADLRAQVDADAQAMRNLKSKS